MSWIESDSITFELQNWIGLHNFESYNRNGCDWIGSNYIRLVRESELDSIEPDRIIDWGLNRIELVVCRIGSVREELQAAMDEPSEAGAEAWQVHSR
jgi:hypothetical protein